MDIPGKTIIEYNLIYRGKLKVNFTKQIMIILIALIILIVLFLPLIKSIGFGIFGIFALALSFIMKVFFSFYEARKENESIQRILKEEQIFIYFAVMFFIFALYKLITTNFEFDLIDIIPAVAFAFIVFTMLAFTYIILNPVFRKIRYFGDSHYNFTDKGLGIRDKNGQYFYPYEKFVWADIPDKSSSINLWQIKNYQGDYYYCEIKLKDKKYINIKIPKEHLNKVAELIVHKMPKEINN